MQIRPESNNTGLRIYNDNAAGGGNVIELTIEAGDEGSITVPVGYTLKLLDTNDLGEQMYGFGPTAPGA